MSKIPISPIINHGSFGINKLINKHAVTPIFFTWIQCLVLLEFFFRIYEVGNVLPTCSIRL
jgi:hypothetical protein